MEKLLILLFPFSFNLFAQEITLEDYNQSQELYNQGRVLLEMQNYEEAIDAFTNAIALNDNAADFYLSRGEVYSRLNNYLEALDDVEMALILAPEQSDMYFLAANIYFKQGKYKEAVANYNLAIAFAETSDLQINLTHCFFNRANAYAALKNYPKAIESYNFAIDSNKDFGEAYHNRGFAKLKISDLPGACEDFTKASKAGIEKSSAYIKDYCQ